MERSQALRMLSHIAGTQHRLVQGRSLVWLEPGRQPLSRYRFAHSLFREYRYQQLDPVRRADLDRMTGEALEQLYGAQVSTISEQLAGRPCHVVPGGLAAPPRPACPFAGTVAADASACRVARRPAGRLVGRGRAWDHRLRLLPGSAERGPPESGEAAGSLSFGRGRRLGAAGQLSRELEDVQSKTIWSGLVRRPPSAAVTKLDKDICVRLH